MDRKTLEYMSERANKGKKIVNRIDALREKLGNLYGVHQVSFSPEKQQAVSISSYNYGDRIVAKVVFSIREAIEKEIELLEQELAEL